MTVACTEGHALCQDNLLMMYPSIEFPNVRFQVEVNLDGMLESMVEGMLFFMYTSNPQYTIYLLTLRYSLLLISLISLASYAYFYKSLQEFNRTFEHKYIYLLSVALVLFNDPLYALTTFYGSITCAVFSTIHVSMFFSLLIFFWMVMFPRMNFEQDKISTRFASWTSIFASFFIFIFLSLLLSIQTVYCRFNPSMHFDIQ